MLLSSLYSFTWFLWFFGSANSFGFWIPKFFLKNLILRNHTKRDFVSQSNNFRIKIGFVFLEAIFLDQYSGKLILIQKPIQVNNFEVGVLSVAYFECIHYVIGLHCLLSI